MGDKHYHGATIDAATLANASGFLNDQARADACYMAGGFANSFPPTTKGPIGADVFQYVLSGDIALRGAVINGTEYDNMIEGAGGYMAYSAAHAPSTGTKSAVDAYVSWCVSDHAILTGFQAV